MKVSILTAFTDGVGINHYFSIRTFQLLLKMRCQDTAYSVQIKKQLYANVLCQDHLTHQVKPSYTKGVSKVLFDMNQTKTGYSSVQFRIRLIHGQTFHA